MKFLIGFLLSLSVIFNSYADVKTDYKEALNSPLFKGTDFPFPDLTARNFVTIRLKEFKSKYSKNDVIKIVNYCDAKDIKDLTSINDQSLVVKGEICSKARRMVNHY